MGTADVLLRKAEEDLARGRLDLAAERYEKVLYANSADVSALVGMARIALATNSFEEARKFAERALSHQSRHPEAAVFGALALEAQGQVEEAWREVSQASQVHSDNFFALFHTGRMLAARGDFDEALIYLDRAMDQNEDDYDVHNLRALVLAEMGDLAEAIDIFRDALKIEPKRLEGYFGLADVLVLANELELAEQVLEQARQTVGNDPVIKQKIAGLKFYSGDITGALNHSERIVKQASNSLQAWLNLGMLRLLNKDVEGAEKALKQARDLAPGHWEPHYQLGVLYDGVSLEEEAIASYSEAARLGPNQWEPHNNLGLLLLASEDAAMHAKAEQLFRKAIDASGAGLFGPFFNLALALTKQNKTSEALELCNKLSQEDLDEQTRGELERLLSELNG